MEAARAGPEYLREEACQIGVTDGLKHAHGGPSILFPHSGTSKETNLLTSKVM